MGAWKSVARRGAGGYPAGIMKKRKAIVVRNTRETQIRVELDVDGSGRSAIETGLPFFNHMLELLAKHSLMDLTIRAKGDLAVDYHHTVEDVGLALGDALNQALGDRKGIERYGFSLMPMDETLGAWRWIWADAPSWSSTWRPRRKKSWISNCRCWANSCGHS